MKKIRTRILLSSIIIVCITALILSSVAVYFTYNSTMDTLNKSMTETVKVAANQVASELDNYKSMVKDIGLISRLSNDEIPQSEKQKILEERMKMHNMEDLTYAGLDGKARSSGTDEITDISEREYFKASIQGESYVSDPIISKSTGKLSIIVSAPLWKNGMTGTGLAGVVIAIFDGKKLSDITNQITVGKTGSTYAIDKTGGTIAHSNYELVKSHDNDIENVKTDKNLTKLAEITKKMVAQETGFEEYSYMGKSKLMTYAPIPNTNGWSLGVTVQKSEFASITSKIIVTAIISLICVIVAIFVAVIGSSKISKPIIACVDRLKLLADGDLTTPVPTAKAKDETKQLLDATKDTVDGLNSIIVDVTQKLDAMANENLDIEVTKNYPGDFLPVEKSLKKIIESFNNVMLQINQASEQVASGSDQVSSGAQALSQGATEQASSIQELSASINEISDQVKRTAINAGEANSMADKVGGEIDSSHQQMQDMIKAISEISEKSAQISKIIKTIDEIAFQTNILALNAAVEAARAGAAGKGFAVVAEEVRNLASKSAQAAKNTTELIESSIESVENGTKIAGETAVSLESVVIGATQITALISEIAQASNEQATSISQVTQGVEQISGVVQTNSATAEESAAASEELSGQAQILNSLVSKFKLRNTYHENTTVDIDDSINVEENYYVKNDLAATSKY